MNSPTRWRTTAGFALVVAALLFFPSSPAFTEPATPPTPAETASTEPAKPQPNGKGESTLQVAPANQEKYLKVYNHYEPFWNLLTLEASERVRKRNYERIFDEARRKVRSWEAAHIK